MTNIVDLYAWRKTANQGKSVTYTIRLTQHEDGEISTIVEDVDDDPDTEKVMRLLTMLVTSYQLRKYTDYIAENLPEHDDE